MKIMMMMTTMMISLFKNNINVAHKIKNANLSKDLLTKQYFKIIS